MELGGVTEVAAVLGVSKQRVAAIRSRPNFPQPEARLAQGPVWDLAKVRRWAVNSRQPRGRPRTNSVRRLIAGRYELDVVPDQDPNRDYHRATDLIAVAAGTTPSVVAIRFLERPCSSHLEEHLFSQLEVLRLRAHPYVVPVLAFDIDADGHPFYVTPLPRRSLVAALDSDEMNEVMVLDALRQVSSAAKFLLACDPSVAFSIGPSSIFQLETSAWCIADLRPDGGPLETARLVGQLRDVISLVAESRSIARDRLFQKSLAWIAARLIKRSPTMSPDVLIKLLQADLAEMRDVIGRAHGRHDLYNETAWIVEAVRSGSTDLAVLSALLRPMVGHRDPSTTLHEGEAGAPWIVSREQALSTMTLMSREQIARLWNAAPSAFASALLDWSRDTTDCPLDERNAEAAASFLGNAMQIGDEGIVCTALQALVSLVGRCSTWQSRGVLVSALQEIRDAVRAGAAIDGLKGCDPCDLQAAFAQVDRRWLHPVLRGGLDHILSSDVPIIDVSEATRVKAGSTQDLVCVSYVAESR
jgi:hypothetical protein